MPTMFDRYSFLQKTIYDYARAFAPMARELDEKPDDPDVLQRAKDLKTSSETLARIARTWNKNRSQVFESRELRCPWDREGRTSSAAAITREERATSLPAVQFPTTSVVRITRGDFSGTGVIVRHRFNCDMYDVLSCHHVINHGGELRVQFTDGDHRRADIIDADADIDCALLRVCSPTFAGVAELAPYNPIQGEDARIYGYGGGYRLQKVDGKFESRTAKGTLRISNISIRGDSGGPMVGSDGRVYGIVSTGNSTNTFCASSVRILEWMKTAGQDGDYGERLESKLATIRRRAREVKLN